MEVIMKWFKLELFSGGLGIILGKYAIGIITKSRYGKQRGDWYIIRFVNDNRTFDKSVLVSYHRWCRRIPLATKN